MLKLEKKARDQGIHISIRAKEPFLSRSLLLAFSMAVALHLLGITIFHIKPFGLGSSERIHSPVTASADVSTPAEEKESSALAQIEQGQLISRYILEPRASIPELPAMPQAQPIRQMEYIKEHSQHSNPFVAIEKDLHAPSFTAADACREFTPIAIHISGPLAAKMQDSLSFAEPLPSFLTTAVSCSLNSQSAHRALYSIQVEDKTGEIFWYEPILSPDSPEFEKLAGKILRNLRFHQETHAFVTTGEIEIIFTVPEGEHPAL